MMHIFADFHFLRPLWFLALLPIAFIVWRLIRQERNQGQWQELIAPELLPYLLEGKITKTSKFIWGGLATTWLVTTFALAGPVWEKRPVAVEKNSDVLVIALDLSPSMLSQDLKPSRLVRARLKILDALNERTDGLTGLIVYAGDAHVVSPLTEDANTIRNLLPDLTPDIMPLSGSNTEAALARAAALIKDAGFTSGNILLITDGVESIAADTLIANKKEFSQISVNILGVGTTNPTPIPSSRGGFVRNANHSIVTTQIEPALLAKLARELGGKFHIFSDNENDIKTLLQSSFTLKDQSTQSTEREFDVWFEYGNWLIVLLIPAMLYAFRRGVLIIVMGSSIFFFSPQPTYALEFTHLFQNSDQRAKKALDNQEAEKAAELFKDPQWQAAAEYRAGNYDHAATLYEKDNSATGNFNRGNALAKANKLEEAIKAYEAALKLDPNLEDAKKNKVIIEKLKQEQKDNQQQSDQNKDSQQDDESKDNQENSGENSDQGNSDQDNSDQNNSDQNSQSKDSENKDSNNSQEGQNPNNQETSSPEQQNPNDSSNANESNSSQSDNSASEQNGFDEDLRNPADTQDGQQASSDDGGSNEAQQNAETDSNDSENNSEINGTESPETPPSDSPEMQAPVQAATEDDNLTNEERQALEQWLRKVPDEPGLLLRNKFKDQYRQRRQDMYNGDWSAPENGAAERW